MKRSALLGTLLVVAACTPTATAPTPSASPTALKSAVTPAPKAAVLTPTPQATAATAAPTAQPSAAATSPTPRLTAARTPAPTPTDVPVRHDGQWLVAAFDPPQPWYFGEGTSAPATQAQSYTLNGASLAGATVRCTVIASATSTCAAVELLPAVRIRNGVRYELALSGRALGSFVASGLAIATPEVISVTATQFYLTVTFDRPMLHVGACGAQSWALGSPGTIEYVRGVGQGFPAPAGAYTSASAGYREFLSSFVSAADIAADCRTVRFGSGWGAPTGEHDVTVSGVADVDGNLVRPRTFRVSIDDEGPPKLMFAQLELQTAEKKVIRVAYSEAMAVEYVTDVERYYLNGKLIAAETKIECVIASCTWVRLTFAPTTFAYGADNTLTIVGVRDLAGNAMTPDIATSGTFQVR